MATTIGDLTDDCIAYMLDMLDTAVDVVSLSAVSRRFRALVTGSYRNFTACVDMSTRDHAAISSMCSAWPHITGVNIFWTNSNDLAGIWSLKRLQMIELTACSFDKADLQQAISNCAATLRVFMVKDVNGITTDDIVDCLAQCQRLANLDIRFSPRPDDEDEDQWLSLRVARILNKYPSLHSLTLNGVGISDAIIACLSFSRTLKYFGFGYTTFVSDEGLELLETCPTLTRIVFAFANPEDPEFYEMLRQLADRAATQRGCAFGYMGKDGLIGGDRKK